MPIVLFRTRSRLAGSALLIAMLLGEWVLPAVAGQTPGALRVRREIPRETVKSVAEAEDYALTSEPTPRLKTFSTRKRLAGAGTKAPARESVVLRVRRTDDWSEVGAVTVGWFPENLQFIPGTSLVFFSELGEPGSHRIIHKVWDWRSGSVRVALESSLSETSSIMFLSRAEAVTLVAGENRQSELRPMALTPDLRLTAAIGNHSAATMSVGKLVAISAAAGLVAHAVGGKDVTVSKLEDGKVIRTISLAPLLIAGVMVFSPDGRYLAVSSSEMGIAVEGSTSVVSVFESRSFTKVGDIRIPYAVALAISPDARYVAAAFALPSRKGLSRSEEPVVSVFTLSQGKLVADGRPRVHTGSSGDPFRGRITYLRFLRKGGALVSSAYDTVVWDIPGSQGT